VPTGTPIESVGRWRQRMDAPDALLSKKKRPWGYSGYAEPQV